MDFNKQKMMEFFHSGKSLSYEFRMDALKKLQRALWDYEDELTQAIFQDFNKSAFEAFMTELLMVNDELDIMMKNLKTFMKPKKVGTSLLHFKSSSRIYYEPYGIVLIISPWNYPITLSLTPLIGAIAAGNCVVLKPSSKTTRTSAVLSQLLTSIFPKEYVTVVQGSSDQTHALIQEEMDYIVFTGSPSVGEEILASAAPMLTPVLLELGGKSPAVVFSDADIEKASARLVWGKLVNAGQTCIAPDYLLLEESIAETFIAQLTEDIVKYYGDNPLESEDFPSIIDEKNYERIKSYLHLGECVYGGKFDDAKRKIHPTLLLNPPRDSDVMTTEIFGPVLPILTFTEHQEPVHQIRSLPKPLAFYLFTEDQSKIDWYMENISFGNGCINDTLIQFANSNLPFGGVGNSGMGQYHGEHSFETFSHQKSVSKKTNAFDIPLRYPPYSEKKLNTLKKIVRKIP